jgi:hypothetical protein
MSGLSALSWVTPALSGFLAGFQRWLPNMSGPRPEHVQISNTQWLDFLVGYKRPPMPLEQGWPLSSTCKHFKTLSWAPNLSPTSFIQIQTSYERFEPHSWVIHSIFNSSTSLMISVCLLLLGIHYPRWTRLSESHQGCGGLRKVCIALSFVGIWLWKLN